MMGANRRYIFEQVCPSLARNGLGVLDVGCRGGSHPLYDSAGPLLAVVGFEPDELECRRLQAAAPNGRFKSVTHLPYALGEQDGRQTLHVARSRGASSFYQPNCAFLNRFPDAARYDVVSEACVPVRSLDSLVEDPAGMLPAHLDFIKIDTQGSELAILRGARLTLESQVVAVETEVEFARLYEGQPLFRDVDALLDECGFALFKLRRQEWVRRGYERRPHLSAGQLVFGDALYLRDPFASSAWTPKDAHQAEALVLIASLYDLYDFALELLSLSSVERLVDASRLRPWILKRSRRLGSPLTRLRAARAQLVRGERFTHYARRWARGDGKFYSVTP